MRRAFTTTAPSSLHAAAADDNHLEGNDTIMEIEADPPQQEEQQPPTEKEEMPPWWWAYEHGCSAAFFLHHVPRRSVIRTYIVDFLMCLLLTEDFLMCLANEQCIIIPFVVFSRLLLFF